MSTSFKDFGEIVPEESGLKEFGEIVPDISKTRSVISAPIKGAIKGAAELASFKDPITAGLRMLGPKAKMEEAAIEKALPTREGPLEKGLERGGRLAIATIGGPETLLAKGIRTAAGAGLGQLAEEMGAPEWVQSLAELSAFASPSGKFIPKQSQKESVKFLRKEGLTDRQIIPLIKAQNGVKGKINKFLSKFSQKGEKVNELSKEVQDKLGTSYKELKKAGRNLYLKGDSVIKFDDKLSEAFRDINPRYGRLIEKDVETLRNRGVSSENLINFWQDINDVIGKEKGGKAVLGVLKKPVYEAMNEINPNIAKKFVKINEFYSKKMDFFKKLKPLPFEGALQIGKYVPAIGALFFGDVTLLTKVLGYEAASRVAREFLINPKLQNIGKQIIDSASKNKTVLTEKLLSQFNQESENQKVED